MTNYTLTRITFFFLLGVNLKAIQEATGAEIQAPKGERDATATTAMVRLFV